MLPYINSGNKYNRSDDERRAQNTPIQGSAADIMKRAQNTVYEKIGLDTATFNGNAVNVWDGFIQETKDLLSVPAFMRHGHTDMIAQIHDEIICEIDDDLGLIEKYAAWQKAVMEIPPLPGFPIQLEAEASIAYSWGQKQDLDKWLEVRKNEQ